MKRRRVLLFSIIVVLALCAACGLWLHRERHQYALNRQLIDALVKDDTKTALALVNAGADPNTRHIPLPAPSFKRLFTQWLHHTPPPANFSPTAFTIACGLQQVPLGNDDELIVEIDESIPLLRAMLEHGANLQDSTLHTRAGLTYAAGEGRQQTVELLLQHGANPNAGDINGQTPLMLGSAKGSVQVVRLLLAHGANPNVQDVFGEGALFHAMYGSHPASVIPELLVHGADVHQQDHQGMTPLKYAHLIGRADLVRLLKQHAAK